MDNITEYKCPACGGAMEFDSQSQKMKCPYCDSIMDLEEFERRQKELEGEFVSECHGWLPGEKEGMRIYVCKSCGGEIVADESTGATSCPFCGNKVTMKAQFEGDLRPDYVIPFKLDKEVAKQAYLNHLKGKKFLPKCFKEQNHIEEIKGLYVPFWVYDVDTYANVNYKAEKVRVWRNGDTEYTETKFYDIVRAGNISFDHIPVDSSKKMDDVLMESIEPFDFHDAVEFKAAYFAGYLADRFDVVQEDTLNRVENRVANSAKVAFRNTVYGYDSVISSHSNVNFENTKCWYTLYPVWILNTKWNGKDFVFAMNGQTGKMVGDLPADSKTFWMTLLGLGSVLSAILIFVTYWFF